MLPLQNVGPVTSKEVSIDGVMQEEYFVQWGLVDVNVSQVVQVQVHLCPTTFFKIWIFITGTSGYPFSLLKE